MIIDQYSIDKFGEVPKVVLDLAKKADIHGRSFSQWTSSLYLFYKESENKSLNGWMIIDNLNRGIYNSILYCADDKKFYMHNTKDSMIYEYRNQDCCLLHASQYFLMGITDKLINKNPSERNSLWKD